MENNYKIFKEMDKRYISKLNLELKLSYLMTDIIFPVSKSTLKTQLKVI